MDKIIVSREDGNFFMMYKGVFADKNVSLKARGLLSTIMALPQDWEFSIKGICAILQEGDTAVRTAVNELIEHGYCSVVQERDEEGKIKCLTYTFFEKKRATSTFEPHAENPNMENPNVENQGQYNIQENKINKEYNIRKENTKRKDCFYDYLIEKGADKQSLDDWMVVRRKKNAPLTQSAINLLEREALKAGKSIAEAVRICAEHSWQGFRSNWMINIQKNDLSDREVPKHPNYDKGFE